MCVGSGCVIGPTDRTATGPVRSTVVAFSGYGDVPSTTVTLEARTNALASYTAVATATTGPTRTAQAFGADLFPWSISVAIPDVLWEPGATGFRTQIRARSATREFFALETDWLDCYDLYSDNAETFVRECTNGGSSTINLCTSNYLPFSSRRSTCPGRRLSAVRPTSPARTDRWPLPDATTTVVPPVTPSSLRWRGDALSFVDVFDTTAIDAVGGANVLRVGYPSARTATTELSVDPPALFASTGVPLASFPWRTTGAIRQYDRGECSFFLNWRAALNALLTPATPGGLAPLPAAVSAIMVPGVGTVRADFLSRTSLRPVLRTNGEDAIQFTQLFSLTSSVFGNIGRLDLTIRFRVVPTPGGLAGITTVLDPDPTGQRIDYQPNAIALIGTVFGAPDEATVEARIRTSINTLLPGAVAAAVPAAARFLVFRRVFERPDGIEFVLVDNSNEFIYPTVRDVGLCQCDPASPTPVCRAPGGTTAPVTGLLFSLWDPVLASDPPAFGDPRT